jgi:hypothetical protein
MIALLLALLCSPVACPHPHRSQAPIAAFKKAHPCPAKCRVYVKVNGKFKVWRWCGRCQVDHVCARACGGPDVVSNLQWLLAEENRAKSADCSLCKGLKLKCD